MAGPVRTWGGHRPWGSGEGGHSLWSLLPSPLGRPGFLLTPPPGGRWSRCPLGSQVPPRLSSPTVGLRVEQPGLGSCHGNEAPWADAGASTHTVQGRGGRRRCFPPPWGPFSQPRHKPQRQASAGPAASSWAPGRPRPGSPRRAKHSQGPGAPSPGAPRLQGAGRKKSCLCQSLSYFL